MGTIVGEALVKAEGTHKNERKKNRQVFRKPKSQRRIEIESLRKIFDPTQIDSEIFQINLTPSDPAFPFPITVLDFDLKVPQHYPHDGNEASIHVNNKEIPRGHALNVERGFAKFPGALSEKVEQLDKDLEHLLQLAPQKTITIVRTQKGTDTKPRPPTVNASSAGQEARPNRTAPAPAPVKNTEETGDRIESGPKSKSKSESESEFDSDSDSDSESESESDFSLEDAPEEPGMERKDTSNRPSQRGTEIVFPDFAMKNLSVCEIVSLNLLFKCGRCKHHQEFRNLMSAEYGHDSKPKVESCEKCGLGLLVAYRKEFLHMSSSTAGFLDVSGGNVVDMLPSSFSGQCGECGTQSPLFRNVDFGTPRELLCRNCHAHLSIKLELFRFDVLTTDTLGSKAKSAGAALAAAKREDAKKEKVKLTGGEPLPSDGACEHYRKSLRWFRFSCCQRIFPCDRCHDSEMGHASDLITRMVCGKCSREQNFAQACKYCNYDFTVKRSGYWEGGTGTRDKKLLRNKDKRKHLGNYHQNEEKNEVHFQGKSKEVH